MEWVKMQNFKDQALFLSSDYKSSGFSNITRWRGSIAYTILEVSWMVDIPGLSPSWKHTIWI